MQVVYSARAVVVLLTVMVQHNIIRFSEPLYVERCHHEATCCCYKSQSVSNLRWPQTSSAALESTALRVATEASTQPFWHNTGRHRFNLSYPAMSEPAVLHCCNMLRSQADARDTESESACAADALSHVIISANMQAGELAALVLITASCK